MTIYQYQRDCEGNHWDHCFGIITEDDTTEWHVRSNRVIYDPIRIHGTSLIGTF